MENKNFLERLAETLGQNATVKNVYGEPVVVKDKTILPVARVSYGFGGGSGRGKNTGKRSLRKENPDDIKETNKDKIGGGGGLSARPVGVYEISAQKTTFIPANINRELMLAACFGFILGRFFRNSKK